MPMPGDHDSRTALIRADSAPSGSGRRTSSWTLPPDLLAEAVGRLRSSALLYALAYFLAAFFPCWQSMSAGRCSWPPRVNGSRGCFPLESR
jgi:hypothetical protein